MHKLKFCSLMVLTALSIALTQQEWLIEPSFAFSQLPRIEKYLNGDFQFGETDRIEKNNRLKCQAFTINAKTKGVNKADDTYESAKDLFDKAEPGSVAIIPIKGAVMKDDYCGWPGTKTLAAWTVEADNHPNISAIVHYHDSPGGAVDGTFAFVDTAKATTKPLVSFADGLQASASYAIGSAANERWASHRTTRVGSIGTMISLVDYSGLYEKWGVKEHVINADTSPDKNKSFLEARKGNYGLIKSETLNPLNEIFLSYVRGNVPNLKEGNPVGENLPGEPLTGKVYLAEQALAFGLIDHIGTLEMAVERAKELADSNYKMKIS